MALLTALSFLCLGLPRVVTNAAAFALFLKVFDASLLPYTYVGAAVVAPLVSSAFLRLQRRLSFTSLLIVTLLGDAAALAFFRLGMSLPGARWVVMAVTIWVEVEWMLVSLVFWGLAERALDIREAKRLFGVVSSGEPAAVIAGGLAIPLLLKVMGTADLLWVSVGAVLASAVLIRHVGQVYADRLGDAPEEGTVDHSARSPSKLSRYVYLILAVTVVADVAHFFVDNAFYDEAESRFPDSERLASFIGVFFGLTGLVGLLLSLLLSDRLLRRYGIQVGLFSLPALLIAGAVAVLGSAGMPHAAVLVFAFASFAKLGDEAFRNGLYGPAFKTLYQPLAPGLRTRAQAITEGFGEPLAAGIAGLLLLVLNRVLGFHAVGLFGAALGVVVGWLALAVLLKREYPLMLQKAIAMRRFGEGVVTIDDDASLTAVKRGLLNSRPSEVIYAVHLLQSAGYEPLAPLLVPLLKHPSPDVRLDVLVRIEDQRFPDALAAVQKLLHRDDLPRIKGAALRAVASLQGADAVPELGRYLGASEPGLRADAMIGLMRYGGIEGVLEAGPPFLALARSTEVSDRHLAVQVLDELAIPQFHGPLLTLLKTDGDEVRRQALRVAEKLNVRQLRPVLFELLHAPTLAAGAAAAIAAAGDEVLPELNALFARADTPHAVRQRVLEIYGRIGSRLAVRQLLAALGGADLELCQQAAQSLQSSNFHATGEAREPVEQHLRRTVGELPPLFGALTDLGREAETELLRRDLEQTVAELRARMFVVLALLFPRQLVEEAARQTATGSDERRAYALELVDTLLPPEMKALVLPVLEPDSGDRSWKVMGKTFPQPSLGRDGRLKALASGASGASPWARACAIHAMGRLGLETFRNAIIEATTSSESRVRETAARALHRLRPSDVPTDANREAPMLLTIEKVMILRDIGIFANVPDRYLADIASLVEEEEVPAGQLIIREGDLGSTMYVIASGRVRVLSGGRAITEIGEHDVFGELAVLDPEPRSASIEALVDTHLLKLSHAQVDDLMASNMEIVRGFVRMLCSRLRESTR